VGDAFPVRCGHKDDLIPGDETFDRFWNLHDFRLAKPIPAVKLLKIVKRALPMIIWECPHGNTGRT
jgi:hypothetical protein